MLDYILAAGGGAVVLKLGEYLFKRWIERRGSFEALEIDHKTLEVIAQFLTERERAAAQGVHLSAPASLLALVQEAGPSMQDLADAAVKLAGFHIRARYECPLLLEGIVAQHPEHREMLEVARKGFVVEYARCSENVPQVLEALYEPTRRLMAAYYNWIVNPSEANKEAFMAVASEVADGIRSGSIRVGEF
jgi:hypothetical protein